MDYAQILEQIRLLIREKLIQLGGSADTPTRETMLIRNGFFCGRRFTNEGLHAVWFVEEHEVKFYRADGALLEVMELTSSNVGSEPRRAA